MHFRIVALSLLLFSGGLSGRGDLVLGTSLPYDTFLTFEGIPFTVSITNDSGRPLLLGGSNATAELRLVVTNDRGHSAPDTDRALLADTWYVSDESQEKETFEIASLKRIRRPGNYKVKVEVKDLGTGRIYASRPLRFSLTNGAEQKDLRVGREDRMYFLKSVQRKRSQRLLLQVASADENIFYYTYELEKYLPFYPPELKRDAEGRIHTLHYRNPTSVVHCGFDRKGVSLFRHYYKVPGGPSVRLRPGGPDGMGVPDGERVQ